MQDFAYLFSDSVAAWLNGRGDARFQRYERHYRIERAAANDASAFNLERSNEQYATRCRRTKFSPVSILDSKPGKSLIVFLIILWGDLSCFRLSGKTSLWRPALSFAHCSSASA